MSFIDRAVLVRLWIVVVLVPAIAVLTYIGWNWLAVTLGILSGTVFFLWGMGSGGGIGNARSFGQGPADVTTRIGVCLAASGLASYALGHQPPFPLSFRIFYMILMTLVSIVALVLAWKGSKQTGL